LRFTLICERPQPSEFCVDLGSSPGGWTWVLQKLGARVLSVDKAALDPSVAMVVASRAWRRWEWDISGRPTLERDFRGDRARIQSAVERTRVGDDYVIEFRNIWPDGTIHWVDGPGRSRTLPAGSIRLSASRRTSQNARLRNWNASVS
jgi:hypothetical protein